MTAARADDMTNTITPPHLCGAVHEAIAQWAIKRPDRLALTKLSNRGDVQTSLTYAQLDQAVRAAARHLQARVMPGERVVLIPDDNIGFAVCFLAVLHSGGIPVPAAVASGEAARRLDAIVADCQPVMIISARGKDQAGLPGMRFADAIESKAASLPTDGHATTATTPAFIQYSSGSTGRPKGVLISHGNVMYNHNQITNGFGHDADTVMLNWAPLFHDMGLMGGMLHPLLLGISCYSLQPRQFLARPKLWLQAISDYGVTTSGGPSFAFDLCLSKIKDADLLDLDLSRWSVAYCGAEPIRPGALVDFTHRFRQAGLPPTAAFPCYGMAEMTLYATSPAPGTPLLVARRDAATNQFAQADIKAGTDVLPGDVISVGAPCDGTQASILHTDSDTRCLAGTEGEIALNGPQRAQRYWSQDTPDTTTGLAGTGPFRTGDLGFVLDGNLYVTGRLKELIVFEGRNIHPADVERVVADIDGIDRRVMAFQTGDMHQVVILCEAQRNADPAIFGGLANRIARHVASQIGLRVDQVGFLHDELLPKTTSGKAQRSRASAMLRDGGFTSLTLHDPVAGQNRLNAQALTSQIRAQLQSDFTQADLSRSWIALGFVSLQAAQCAAQLQERGFDMTQMDLLAAPALTGLINAARETAPAGDNSAIAPPTSAAIRDWCALRPQSGRYTLSVCLELITPIPLGRIRAAMQMLRDRHPVLELPFEDRNSGSGLSDGLTVHRKPSPDAPDFAQSVKTIAARAIDLGSAPPFTLHAFAHDGDCKALLLCVHHAVTDLLSLQILLQDFGAALAGDGLTGQATKAEIAGRATFASPPPAHDARFARLPAPHRQSKTAGPTGRSEAFVLDRADHAALAGFARDSGVTLNAVILAATQIALAAFGDGTGAELEVPFHNRHKADDFGAMGCFVTVDRLQSTVDIGGPLNKTVIAAQNALLSGLAPDPVSRQSKDHLWGGRQAVTGARYAFAPTTTGDGIFPAGLACRGQRQKITIAGQPCDIWRPAQHVPVADLVVTFGQTNEGGLAISLEYDSHSIDSDTIRSMTAFLGSGLGGLARDPARADRDSLIDIAKPAILSGASSGTTPAPTAHHACLATDRFGADTLACLDHATSTTWTRHDLDMHSRRIGALLTAQGVTKDDRVAVIGAHGMAQTAIMLGIWGIGAVYCPIDRFYPDRRIRRINDNLDARLVIDDLDAMLESSKEYAPLAPCTLDGQDPAYIVHTSGTTGQPKGVVVTHAALANTVQAQAILGVTAEDRLVPFASLGFDAAIFETVLALGQGGHLCFALAGRAESGRIRRAIHTARPDVLLLPPSLLAAVGTDIPTPRITMCAGEACPATLTRNWHSRTAFWNLYGPSETAIWASYEQPTPSDNPRSIGKPVTGMTACVANVHGTILPAGASGELVLSGAGLALGYLGNPGQTAASFVAMGDAKARFYRTGDMARITTDRRIFLLGRADDQVKINGVRIELGEVHQIMLGHAAVRAASVWTDKGPNGPLVCAAIEAHDAEWSSLKDLRAYLYDRLPPAFVPAAIHLMDTLPIGAHGKLDQKAITQAAAAPRPAAPVDLSGWHDDLIAAAGDSLPNATVTAQTDLLQAGLTSLQILRFCTAVSRRTGRRIEPEDVYLQPVLHDLAAVIDRAPAVALTYDSSIAMGAVPLSAVQNDLWLMHKLGDDWINTISIVVSLKGFNDTARWEKAINRTCIAEPIATMRINASDADALRMTFTATDPESCLSLMSLKGTSEDSVQEQTTQAAKAGFDLENEPPLRIILWSDDKGAAYLQLVAHHIALDGWAAGLLLSRIGMAFGSDDDINASRTPLGPVLQHLAGRKQLANGPATVASRITEIGPLDPAPDPIARIDADTADEPQRTSTQVDGTLWDAITRKAAASGATRFGIVAGAFALALAKRQRRQRSAITVVYGNRTVATSQAILGLAEPVPIGVQLDGSRTLDAALRAIAGDIKDAACHTGPALSQYHAAYRTQFATSAAPFLECFIVQSDPQFSHLTVDDTLLRTMPFRHGGIKAQTLLDVCEDRHGCSLLLENRPTRMSPKAAELLLGRTLELLADWIDRPDQTVSAIPDISASETQLILHDFQGRSMNYDFSRSAAHLGADMMQAQPDAIILQDAEQSLSARQVTQRINRLANTLISRRVKVGAPVGVCVPFGIDRVIALHGVMRAGAAFVPLSPDLPPNRLTQMIRQLDLTQVITPAGEALINMDNPPDWIACDQPDAAQTLPRQRSGPDDRAYILFTSGSTGQPKAVANTHKGLLNRIFWMQDCAPVTSQDVILQKTDFTFDVAVWELFWPFMTEARLHTLRPGMNFDMRALFSEMRQGQVTVAHFVPSVLREFLAVQWQETDLPHLRYLFTSGETLERSDCQAVANQLDCTLFNFYGPTEAAIDVTAWQQTPDLPPDAIPIGAAVANTQLYVLRDDGTPAPLNTTGELFIAGTQVAEGYYNDPDRTKASFSMINIEGNDLRAYRTGDIVRWRDDGTLAYLGRSDDQVKLRGIRVHPGEVQAILMQHPDVGQAAVIVMERGVQAWLGACVVATDNTTPPSQGDITTFAKAHLPSAICPAQCLILNKLPLTSSGKIDRAALATMLDHQARQTSPDTGRTASKTETALQALWARILDRDDTIDVDRNFFDAGGNSLLLVRLQAGLKDVFDHDISVVDLMRHTSIASLAKVLDGSRGQPATVTHPRRPSTLANRARRRKNN